MKRMIALLRGINVTGRNKIAMAELRAACGKLGWKDVETYIQSGNIVFRAAGAPAALEAALEGAIEKAFGLSIPVVVRTAEAWHRYLKQCPFEAACAQEPNFVLLLATKKRPAAGAEKTLAERAQHGEIVRVVGDAVFIHFKAGVGKSKLSPAVIDRAVGSSATGRNWRTVIALDEMLAKE